MNFLDMGMMEIGIVLIVALLIFGPGSVPKVAKQLGTWVRTFRKITSDMTKDFTKALDAEEKKSSTPGKSSKPFSDIPKPGEIKDMAKDAVKKKAAKSLDKFLGVEKKDDSAG